MIYTSWDEPRPCLTRPVVGAPPLIPIGEVPEGDEQSVLPPSSACQVRPDGMNSAVESPDLGLLG
jgi:hypothetical protein